MQRISEFGRWLGQQFSAGAGCLDLARQTRSRRYSSKAPAGDLLGQLKARTRELECLGRACVLARLEAG